MNFNVKNLKRALFIVSVGVAYAFLSGCASYSPSVTRSFLGFTDKGDDGAVIRAFTIVQYNEIEDQYDNARAVEFTEDADYETGGYEHIGGRTFFLNRRYSGLVHATILLPFADKPLIYTVAPALGVQIGDLVDFHVKGHVLLAMDVVSLKGVRIVCKFHDEECIARENRSFRCDNGAMIIDGDRREDRPCGGFGGASEHYAIIVGPVDDLHGSLDNYLQTYNSPYDADCLLITLSCGAAEGKAVEYKNYEAFLERWPNYMAAQNAASDFADERMYEGGHEAEREWAIHLSENMFSPVPVAITKDEFIQEYKHRNAVAE